MEDPLAVCTRLLDHFPREEVDEYARKQLRHMVMGYRQTPKKLLADVGFEVDDQRYTSLLSAMAAGEWSGRLKFVFFSPVAKENWDYNRPARQIKVIRGGFGVLEGFDYNPYALEKWDLHQGLKGEEVMVRAYSHTVFIPESIKRHTERMHGGEAQSRKGRLMTIEEMWGEVRGGTAIPFEIRVCCYTRTTRHWYDIDLLDSKLLKDFRGGALPVTGRRARSSMEMYALDKVLASLDVKEVVRRVLIMVFEREETMANDLVYALGMTEPVARNTLSALVSRGLVQRISRGNKEIYEAEMDAILTAAEAL
ncbi:MAG: helix-turn-helix transcriptional regulator [Candidatus Thermoplasmatota archaeon]